jgi:regulator of protease activity HflC (stomatin/prohibitin superfamily)
MDIASVIRFLSLIVWAVAIGLVVVTVARAGRGQGVKGLSTMILVTIIVAAVFSVVGAGVVFVQPDERGVVISALDPKGYRSQELQPGLRWIIPFAEQVKTYSISRHTYTMSSVADEGQQQGDDSIQARTKDGQIVFVDASVIYSVDPNNVINLHILWQDRYEDGVVRPQVRGSIRDAVSQFGVEEIVSTNRGDLEQTITQTLTNQFSQNNLVLVDFILRNIRFSDEYAAAVEQKQIAEQQAQQAKFVVEQKKQEAEQARQVAQGQADAVVIAAKGQADARVIQAEAEAKALQLIAEVLKTNPNLLTYQYITQLAPNIQVMLLPSGSPFILPLPQAQGGTSSQP